MTILTVVELLFSGHFMGAAWFAARDDRAAGPSPPSSRAEEDAKGAISVLIPCEGEEPGLASRLTAARALEGIGEVIVCTASLADPAAEIARAAGVSVVVDDAATSGWTNPKARHLEAGLRAARGPLIVLADADVTIDAARVAALRADLTQPGVSGVFAAPMAEPSRALGSRVLRAALGGSLYAWPALVSLTRALAQPIPMSGALVAFRARDLPNGLAPAAHAIGDDLAVAEALAARGRLELMREPVVCIHGDVSFATARAILGRWVFVALCHSPWRFFGFPLLFSASPLLLLAIAASPLQPGAIGLTLAFTARLLAAGRIRRRLLREPLAILDMLLAEVLLLQAAFAALWGLVSDRELGWRKRRYRLGRGGRILSVREVE